MFTQLSRLEEELHDTMSRSRFSDSTPMQRCASDSRIITTKRNSRKSVDKITPIPTTPVGPHYIVICARPNVFQDKGASNQLKPHDIQIVRKS